MIGAELDGELSAAEQAALRAHLETCENCRRYRAAVLAVSDALQNELAEPPASLSAGVMARVRASGGAGKQRRPRRFGPSARLAALAAALALVIWAGFRMTGAGSAAPDTAGVSRSSAASAASTEAAPAGNAAAEDTETAADSAPMAAAAPESAAGEPAADGADSAAGSAADSRSVYGASNDLTLGLPAAGTAAPACVRAEIRRADGTAVALTDADALAWLTEQALAFSETGMQPAAEADYTVTVWPAEDAEPAVYSLWVVDGALYGRAGDGSEAFLSPVTAGDFASLLG